MKSIENLFQFINLKRICSINIHRRTVYMKGFSLFDLVCILGILTILTAITLPNFLTAQTQSKVSRVKKDMRYIGIAIETYKIDNNTYPWLKDTGSGPNNGPYNDWTWAGLPLTLSTPVAYIAQSIMWDAFPDLNSNSRNRSTYRYLDNNMYNYLRNNYSWSWIQTITWVGDWVYPTYLTGVPTFQPGYSNKVWKIISNGPDEQFEDFIAYDPTNGTISNGDIARFGP